MVRAVILLLTPIAAVLFGFANADRADMDIEVHDFMANDVAMNVSDSCDKPPAFADTNIWKGAFEVPLWMQALTDESNPMNIFYIIGGPYSANPDADCTPIPQDQLGTNVNLGNTAACRMRTSTVAKMTLDASPENVDLVRLSATDNCMLTGTHCVGFTTALDAVIVKFLGGPFAVGATKLASFPPAAAKIPSITPVLRYFKPGFSPKGSGEWFDHFIVHPVGLPSGQEKWYAIAVHRSQDKLCYIDHLFVCQWVTWKRYAFQMLPERGIWRGFTMTGKRGARCYIEEA